MSAGRPRGTRNDVEAAAAARAAQLAHEEARHIQAIQRHRAHDLAAVRHRRRIDHMSRKRLIEIYGQDVVDEALSS